MPVKFNFLLAFRMMPIRVSHAITMVDRDSCFSYAEQASRSTLKLTMFWLVLPSKDRATSPYLTCLVLFFLTRSTPHKYSLCTFSAIYLNGLVHAQPRSTAKLYSPEIALRVTANRELSHLEDVLPQPLHGTVLCYLFVRTRSAGDNWGQPKSPTARRL
ncbi:hypothetical protein EDB19DRAFT_261915 [Suillus lakei]|nr:hypothetical protein EDB19DRAFT_261915 [Suillus lakei]